MANWRHKIELNAALSEATEKFDLTRVEEPCPDEVKDLICRELEKAPPLRRFVESVRECKTIAAVNRAISVIYDEADRKLVWCGF